MNRSQSFEALEMSSTIRSSIESISTYTEEKDIASGSFINFETSTPLAAQKVPEKDDVARQRKISFSQILSDLVLLLKLQVEQSKDKVFVIPIYVLVAWSVVFVILISHVISCHISMDKLKNEISVMESVIKNFGNHQTSETSNVNTMLEVKEIFEEELKTCRIDRNHLYNSIDAMKKEYALCQKKVNFLEDAERATQQELQNCYETKKWTSKDVMDNFKSMFGNLGHNSKKLCKKMGICNVDHDGY